MVASGGSAGSEAARRRAERLVALRLRLAIGRWLEERDALDPAAAGAALGLPPAEATGLLRRKNRREGDLEALRRAAARLGLAENAAGHWVETHVHAEPPAER